MHGGVADTANGRAGAGAYTRRKVEIMVLSADNITAFIHTQNCPRTKRRVMEWQELPVYPPEEGWGGGG